MVKIKLTAGVYCHNYTIIRAGDPAIEVDEAIARRLVEEKGVAEYVTPPATEPELPAGIVGVPVYSEEMKADELRAIGELCGLTFKKGMSKADMVAALDAHIEANMVEGVEVNEDGEITVEAEDAPAFDAAEAVQ